MSEAPKGGTPASLEGVTVVSPKEARQIQAEGGVLIACYTHMTDWVQARPIGAVHITMDVPKDHKRTDFDLKDAQFDVSALPQDKSVPIVLFCANDTCWKSYHAARLALQAGYKNIYWMRAGIQGWQKALYATESDSKVFMALMDLNKDDPANWVIGDARTQSLKNPTFLDLRSPKQFEKGHVAGAINIPYADLWTFDNLEKLNKSRDIVIIYDDPVVAGALAITLRMLDYKAFILE